MSNITNTEVAIQQPHTEHSHVCDECAREIHETHEYLAELAEFVKNFDLSQMLASVEMPSGPMGMILRSLIK